MSTIIKGKKVPTPKESSLDKLKKVLVNELNGQLFSEAMHGNNIHQVYGLSGGNTIILVIYINFTNELNGFDIFYPSREIMVDPTIAELKKFASR